MDDKIIIDCIGPSVLTITISGAAHSISIATDVIRISGPCGVAEHNLDSLPLIYDAAALGGRLNICDGAGKMVYCWRSLITLQPRSSSCAQRRTDRSSSSSLESSAQTEITTPGSSLASTSSNGSEKRRGISELTGDTSRLFTTSSTANLTVGGRFSHEMTDSRDSISDNTLEEPVIELEGPVNEDLVVRFDRHLRELKRKRDFGKLQSERTCAQCGQCPDKSMVTSCLHLYCNDCLEHLPYELAGKDLYEAHCVVCNDVIIESQSCQHLKELGEDYFLKSDEDLGHEFGQRYIDLEDKDPEQQSTTITATQKNFLVHAVNKLRKLSYGEFFRQPVPINKVNYPTYTGITRPIDLKTMRANLHAGAYPSIELLKADFDQMEQNSRVWNGADHPHTKDAQNLKVAFGIYMIQYPGSGEDFAPRKKAKTKGSKTPPVKTSARAGVSSPPRAAKSAMQGRKYPRDHW